MARSGATTRAGIMDAAEALILEQGFAATAIDRVIERAGVQKGTFFYHFKSKAELGQALVERYAERDGAHLDSALARAEALARDPLQQILVFVGLLIEEARGAEQPAEGCLFASFLNEAGLFDARTHETIRGAFQRWRDVLGPKFAAAMALQPPRRPASAQALTDMMLTLFEGAFVLSKTMRDPQAVAHQLEQFRNYLELLFAPAAERNASTAA